MKMLVWYFHLVHLKKCLKNSIHLKILATFFCFFSLVAYSFKEKEKKPRKFRFAWLLVLFKTLFLHLRYSVYSLVGVSVKCPVYLIIGQGAVNASTHNQSTILQDFLPCFLLALGNHIAYAVKNIFRVN